jgi:hypothetical protein
MGCAASQHNQGQRYQWKKLHTGLDALARLEGGCWL